MKQLQIPSITASQPLALIAFPELYHGGDYCLEVGAREEPSRLEMVQQTVQSGRCGAQHGIPKVFGNILVD
jgi:hypothetical protein